MLMGVLFILNGVAQQQEEIVISVTQGKSASSETYLNGYHNSVSGMDFSYHSSHPDAEEALLVRAQYDVHSIEWQTDTLTVPQGRDFYKFIWLAGLDRAGWGGGPSHRFDFFINGEHWFTFENYKDSTAKNWKVIGKDGAALSFEAHVVDKFGDLFGYMFLNLPQKDFKPSVPLLLRVEGEDANNPEWYMTFKYRFNFTPRVRVEPALVKDKDEVRQQLRISLDNLDADKTVEIKSAGKSFINQPLNVGANIFFLPIQAVKKESNLPITFLINNKLVSQYGVTVKPERKREIFLLSHTHNDIGYTDLQTNVERKQWENLEEALRLIKQTKDYPPDARYKWNMEILWSLESYLKQAPPEKREEVIETIRNGDIGLNGFLVNPLTGLANAVEMSHFVEYARRFTDEFSIPITTAAVSDIPGFTWGIVSALAQSGIKYFASAPNSGDRIGYVIEAWGDKPFYWQSQSGQEKVLFWVAGSTYSMFHEGTLSNLGPEKVMKLVRKLDENDYPYDIYYLPYTLGDNGGPDPNLSDFVKEWNEKYISPRLVIATHRRLFEEFERRYGSTLPTMKGDFTPYWEDGAVSTAYETALNRHAADRLIQGEALRAMLAPGSYPKEDYYSAWRNVTLYDEHTWGASNSVTDPDSPSVQTQWKIKRQFALDANILSQLLLSRVLPHPLKKKRSITAIDVYSTSSWNRTDIVVLSHDQSATGDLVVDEKGKRVPSQRLSTGELAFLAEQIPPFAASRFFVRKGRAFDRGRIHVSATTLENNVLALRIDTATGTIRSLVWKTGNRQLVDTTATNALNQYRYVLGTDPDSAQTLSNVRVTVKEHGRLVASLLIQADAPGCKHFSSEIQIVDGLDRVDIIDQLEKKAVREKEGVHIAFPFEVPNGQLRYDVADGIVRPEVDQLAGSCKNFFSVQSWVDISNEDYGVTWTTADAPLIEVGTITAEQPWLKNVKPSATFYSYVMNNYWHTNYKADQEGLVTFHYSVVPHVGFKPEDAVRRGIECRQPLIVALADFSKPPVPSLIRVDPSTVLVTSFKPNGKSMLMRLYNPTGIEQRVNLRLSGTAGKEMFRADGGGKSAEKISNPFSMVAYGTEYVLVGN